MSSTVIENFYKDNQLPKTVIDFRLASFDRNPDIAKEFEYWIKTNSYINEYAVCVEGYTAAKLAVVSDSLNGDGAFVMLVELRENPKKALQMISSGLKKK